MLKLAGTSLDENDDRRVNVLGDAVLLGDSNDMYVMGVMLPVLEGDLPLRLYFFTKSVVRNVFKTVVRSLTDLCAFLSRDFTRSFGTFGLTRTLV